MSNTREKKHPAINYLLPSASFRFIAFAYLFGICSFTVFRLFFLSQFSGLLNNVPWQKVIQAFLIGVRFDQIPILIALAPFLLFLPWLEMRSKTVRRVVLGYTFLLFAVFFTLLLGDVRFFKYFGTHLNFLAVEYIGEGDTFQNMIFSESKFILYGLLFLAAMAICFIILAAVYNRLARQPTRQSWKHRLIYFFIFAALFAIGIRGRLNLAPIDWGVAYHSQNHFLNQLALNGVYTLGRNLTENNFDPRLSLIGENERFPFVAREEALALTRDLLSQPGHEWAASDSNLKRTAASRPGPVGFNPNVVVIVMESWPGKLTGALGNSQGLTPHFDSLALTGILFTRFFANGIRTNFGLSAILCTFPSLPGRAITKRYDAYHPYVSLPAVLHQRGYYNCFAYGGDLAFDNMEGFFRQEYFDRFYGDYSFPKNAQFSKWGVPDHVLFEYLSHSVDSLPRPFFLNMLTLSFHEPFDLPDSSCRKFFSSDDSSKIFNSLIYADRSLGEFMHKLRQNPVFDSTLFAFVSDHSRLESSRIPLDPLNFHIPLLLYSPSLLTEVPKRIDGVGSQVDILPTIMGLLGGDYEHSSWGRDLLNLPENDRGFATIDLWNRTGFITEEYFYSEELGQSQSFFYNRFPKFISIDTIGDTSGGYRELRTAMRSYMQAAEQLSTPHPR